jgi:hypothetical protein
LSCADAGHVLTKIGGEDFGTCAPGSRRRLDTGFARSRDDTSLDAVKDTVSAYVGVRNPDWGGKFDAGNRYRVKQNSYW